ncbi:endonuclease/exonuclease/phosphatase family protein [Roseobacter sp.]|uniref:endonuclease/exonuclease/phosphatase family protein n=1 Tax=Roseobacter sp. TaxID=1907202 RepID=UPI002600784C|nr:endonuclease/exonuclease/phosphatase family protein [Roseobacter sp.]
MMKVQKIRCATWNIHRAKGTDGTVDAARVLSGIESHLAPLDLDVLALQEADEETRPHARIIDVERITTLTGLDYVHKAPALRWGPDSDGFLGTVLFLGPRLRRTHEDVIDLPGHCHRGAVSVETVCDRRPLRIMSTHLSLSQPLRIVQMRTLGQYLRRRPRMQTIFLGDFNEWRPWGGWMFHPRLVGTALRGPARRTFPSTRPLLPLDRILTDAPGIVEFAEAVSAPDLVRASDHLPLHGVVMIT